MTSRKNKLLDKLYHIQKRLINNESLQVTSLLPIARIFRQESDVKAYLLFLLEESYRLFIDHATLSQHTYIYDTQKQAHYQKAITLLTPILKEDAPVYYYETALLKCLRNITKIQPGFCRISVHATRRKLLDPDLLLLESIFFYTLNYSFRSTICYQITKEFCCDFENHRFKLSSSSLARVGTLIYFFENIKNSYDAPWIYEIPTSLKEKDFASIERPIHL